jgi:hypothetical protein
VPAPAGPPTAAAYRAGQPTRRTATEALNSLGTGLLGLTAVAVYAVLQVLFALTTALNDDHPSKTAFVVIGLPLVAIAAVATVLLVRRAQDAHAAGQALSTVHALAVAAGVLSTTYGVLVVLTALLSEQAAALTLL